MYRRLLLIVAMLVAFSSVSLSAEPKLLFEKPTLSATQIAFVYAGDLWTVSREGGNAQRLTVGAGIETRPHFSPDGKEIAFTGEYDGNVDVFVVPATGGVPRRMTWHPSADQTVGWTPDGKSIIFSSDRYAFSRYTQLFTVPREGGFATPLPLPSASQGSFSPDGTKIAYVPVSSAFNMWKRYRGGRTMPIWIAKLSDSSIEKLPRENSNDFNPMWIGDQIFFLSDRNGPVTLFSYDTTKKTVTQVVTNNGLDFKAASKGPGAIVYEQFGAINLYDLKSGKTHPVEIHVSGDLLDVRPHFMKVASYINHAAISPTGARAVFEARGDIFTVPADKGDIRNLTNTPGVHERSPAWSPDGTRIAYLSDESGEYALHIAKQSGTGDVQKIDLGTPGTFYFNPTWSPDSKKIVYADKLLNLWYVDIETGKRVKVFTDRFTGAQIMGAAWSPDSKWLAYQEQNPSHLHSVAIYSLESGQSHTITDGMSDATSPVFDRGGKYLYLLSSTDDGPKADGSMMGMNKPTTASVYVVVLRKDLPSPLAHESDEEKESNAGGANAPDAPVKREAKEPAAVKIDFEKISQRTLALPLRAALYTELFPGKEGVLFVIEGGGAETVLKFDLKTRKSDKLVEGISYFTVSDNGDKMLYKKGGGAQADDDEAAGGGGGSWFITSTTPAAGGAAARPAGGALKVDAMEVRVDPLAEWKEMYHEGFREERDFFYEPNFHGYDLKAAEKKYEPYVEGLADRADLNYLFEESLGGMTVGHLRVNGGDFEQVKHVPGGLLGADYAVENGHYRFTRIYDGENWNPQLKAPLTEPGVNVAAGEYLLAVNGKDVLGTEDVYSFFEATAGKSVRLRVGPNPNGTGSREVTVVPVASEQGLRNIAWIEDNRRTVDRLSHGKLAYIYLPDTGMPGYSSFVRYFFPQVGKEGVVVDERYNAGGAISDYILDYLQRKILNYRTTRSGEDYTTPVSIIPGPKVLLINEVAGSGGDQLPFHFREMGLGTIVGKTTWGGLVGFSGPQEKLLDGGNLTTPSRGFYSLRVGWEVENHGIKPDVEVDWEPQAYRQGHDSQLEKAVEVLLSDLEKHPLPVYKKPPYPDYKKGTGTK